MVVLFSLQKDKGVSINHTLKPDTAETSIFFLYTICTKIVVKSSQHLSFLVLLNYKLLATDGFWSMTPQMDKNGHAFGLEGPNLVFLKRPFFSFFYRVRFQLSGVQLLKMPS